MRIINSFEDQKFVIGNVLASVKTGGRYIVTKINKESFTLVSIHTGATFSPKYTEPMSNQVVVYDNYGEYMSLALSTVLRGPFDPRFYF